jgi:hypothetical protein
MPGALKPLERCLHVPSRSTCTYTHITPMHRHNGLPWRCRLPHMIHCWDEKIGQPIIRDWDVLRTFFLSPTSLQGNRENGNVKKVPQHPGGRQQLYPYSQQKSFEDRSRAATCQSRAVLTRASLLRITATLTCMMSFDRAHEQEFREHACITSVKWV